MMKIVNQIIRTSIRPQLMDHFGDIELISVEDGIVTVKLLGACRGCPSAKETLEEVVLTGLQAELPDIRQVMLHEETSPELLNMARRILGVALRES